MDIVNNVAKYLMRFYDSTENKEHETLVRTFDIDLYVRNFEARGLGRIQVTGYELVLV